MIKKLVAISYGKYCLAATIFMVGLIITVVFFAMHPSREAARIVSGGKPFLEHYVLNPTLARQIREENDLTDDQFQSLYHIAQREAGQIAGLEAESQEIVLDVTLTLWDKRQKIAAIGFNQRLAQILIANQLALQNALGARSYGLLVDWIENRRQVDASQDGNVGNPAPIRITSNRLELASFPRSYEVYATRYDAGGRYIIALPDKCLKFANGSAMQCNEGYQYGQNYSVAISYEGKTVYATVGESGPWNIDDNYWATLYDPQPRRMFADLPLGVPEAQAAFFNGYNGGVDQFGRVVTSPVAIDISYAVAADLGLPSGNNEVTVSFLWTEGWDDDQSGAGSNPAPPVSQVTPIVASTPNPDGSIVHVIQQGQTLVGIANIYDVPIEDLLTINGLSMDSIILPGDRIIVKGPDPTPLPVSTQNITTVTTKPTETNTPHPSQTPTPGQANIVDPTDNDTPGSTQITFTGDVDPLLVIIGGVAIVGVGLLLWGLLSNRRDL